MPSVSIVIPAKDAAATIEATLRSLIDQDGVDEILLVNDGSHDNTVDIANRLHDERIQILHGPANGIAAALNTGFAAAKGECVARCDADDLFAPGRIVRQAEWLDAHPGFIAIAGGFATITRNGNKVADLAARGAGFDATNRVLHGETFIHFGAWLTRAKALKQVGGARTWFETGEDLDLQFRLAACGAVWYDPEIAYIYRLHDRSITHRQGR
ncbi:MAG TPA: glycosyltransferase family 2 protein, partial [Verrucomicrobiae bacterium]|nr:glycosyltransferase family 2 protein [Verrucomicrobiae bacterium]